MTFKELMRQQHVKLKERAQNERGLEWEHRIRADTLASAARELEDAMDRWEQETATP